MRGLQRFERRLEGAVGNAFARMFKGKVHPAEIARALQRDAEENKVVIGAGRVLVPNTYVIRLSGTDYDHLHEWEPQLVASLTEMVQEQLDAEGWSTYGRIKMQFARDEDLRTGVFGIDSSVDGSKPTSPQSAPAPSAAPLPGAGAGGGFGPAAYPAPAGLPPVPVAPPVPAPARPAPAHDDDGDATQMWAPPPEPPPAAPRAPEREHYLIIDGPNTRIALKAGNNIIGRGSDSRVRITDTGVSRQHADLVVNGHGAVVQDLRSTNGTQVNGRRITSVTLRHGDVIRVGHTVLVYRHEVASDEGR